jgi:hypothetical protein
LVNFYQTTRRYNPEDSHLHTHRRENLKSDFESVSLNRMRVQSRIADISKDVETLFFEVFNKCVYFSLAADESTGITSTA